jgi:signal peptidase I
MEDTISTDELLTVDRGAYDSGDPERLDIVLYANPRPEDGLYDGFVGRIVGLGGETIEASEGKMYINGSLLDEPYLKNPQIPMASFGPIKLEPDEMWLMGDNRQVPMHSRVFGPIPVSELRGRVTAIVNP